MLDLLPITKIVQLLVLAGLVLGGFSMAMAGPEATLSFNALSNFISASSLIVIVGVVVSALAWRFLPLVQEAHFPYLGGSWEGQLIYMSPSGEKNKPVSLEIRHNLFEIDILLETDESISKTLTASAEKRKGFARFRLFHVYESERKEGVADAGVSHRGTTIFAIPSITTEVIEAEYYTEKQRTGKITMSRVRENSQWFFWR